MSAVKAGGGEHANAARGLCQAFHGEQHPLHIGMVDNGGAGFAAALRFALFALLCKGQGLLCGAFGHGHALHPHGKAGGIHHGEHAVQATVFLSHQIADRALLIAKHHGAGGRGVQAQLMLNGGAEGIIARAQ